MKTRINFLDNLRTLMILLVVVLHCGLVYEPVLVNNWIVIDSAQNSSIGLIRMYLDLFVMFTLFFITGYFLPASVKSKTTAGFMISKFKRIILPWLIAVITLMPLYKFIFLYSRGLPQQEWYSYFHIFQRSGGDMTFFANNPAQGWLWFLPVLFIFQVAYLLMNKFRVLNFNISLKSGVVITFLLSLVYSMVIADLELRGWYHSALLHFQRERLLPYFLVFLLGTLCNKHKVFDNQTKNKKLYIWSNIILTISLGIYTAVALNFFFNIIEPGREYYFISEKIDRLFYYTSMLASMFSFLYILVYSFRFSLNKTNKVLRELSRNSYAVYILHMVVLGILAVPLLGINMPAMAKFLVLTIITFAVSNIIISLYRKAFPKKIILRISGLAVYMILLFTLINSNIVYSLDAVSTNSDVKQNTEAPNTGLHAAIVQGDLKTVIQHVNAGSDLNIKEPSNGSSPLITATVFGKHDIVKVLIEAGADINFQNNDGSTPLHTAAFFGYPDIVKELLNHGADPSIKNHSGSTPLDNSHIPVDDLIDIYVYFQHTLGPLGLHINIDTIRHHRPQIINILKNHKRY